MTRSIENLFIQEMNIKIWDTDLTSTIIISIARESVALYVRLAGHSKPLCAPRKIKRACRDSSAVFCFFKKKPNGSHENRSASSIHNLAAVRQRPLGRIGPPPSVLGGTQRAGRTRSSHFDQRGNRGFGASTGLIRVRRFRAPGTCRSGLVLCCRFSQCR